MESPLPGTGRDDRRRGPSEVARRQDRPSPGAARRPLPARERRLFVASLGTGGSFLFARSTDPHLAGRQCRGDPVGRPAGPWWGAPGMTRAIVHDRTRAMHRVAPTGRTRSRQRCTSEQRSTPDAPVVGAVREPPPQCPAPRTRGSSQVLFPRSRNASEFAGSICCSRRKTACAFAVSPAANKNLA